MLSQNSITKLFNIEYSIIQAGMVWISGYKLVSKVSECGGLGLIGSGSMNQDLLREHIQKTCKQTNKPFGVNVPLLREDAGNLIDICIQEGVKIIFTSAGHPGKYIDKLKKSGCRVVHVVSNVKQAKKCEEVGCDAVVAEGVEAGGHNGADEITTFCLIPQVVAAVKAPVIAAGGIAIGSQILAAFSLGAEGVQIGTRFAATFESSAHNHYKKMIVEAKDNDTTLALRKIGLIRVIKNNFSKKVFEAEKSGLSELELKEILGKKKEFQGIFNGDTEEGALEAGQSSGLINEILSTEEVFLKLISEYSDAIKNITSK